MTQQITPLITPLIARKLEQVAPCVQDGWPLREIYRTYHTSSRFVKKWFPDYAGMTAQESGSLSMAIQRRERRKQGQ